MRAAERGPGATFPVDSFCRQENHYAVAGMLLGAEAMRQSAIRAFSFVVSIAACTGVRAAVVDTLTMTEYSKDQLAVVVSLAAVPAVNPTQTVPAFSFSGNLTFPGNDTWALGGISLLLPADTYDGIVNNVPFVAWVEPGNPALYNLLRFHPDGNQGVTTLEIYSDVTLAFMNGLGFGSCRFGGTLGQCPILSDGQSYDVPITRLQPNYGTFVRGNDLRVTFTDIEDVAGTTPLPAALPLFAGGLGVLSLFGWRKRRATRATV